MKPRSIPALSACLLLLPVAGWAVQPGDSREAALAELGAPTGIVAAGPREVLVFPQGELRLRDGVVETIAFRSPEQLAAAAIAAAERTERIARQAAEARALFNTTKSDATFTALPATEQLAFWQSFAARYPMIAVENELAVLRARVAAGDERRAHDLRLTLLEARLAGSEAETARATQLAQRALHRRHDFGAFGFHPIRVAPHRPRPDQRPAPPRDPIPVTPRGQAMGSFEDARADIYRRSIY